MKTKSPRPSLSVFCLYIATCIPCIVKAEALMPTQQMVDETKLVAEMMASLMPQLEGRAVSDSAKILEGFMTSLDPLHLYFTEEQRAEISSNYGPGLWDSISLKGDLAAGFHIVELYKSSAMARAGWIENTLNRELLFDTDETYKARNNTSGWPASIHEADVEWEKRLKHDVLREHMQGTQMDQALKLVNERYNRIANDAANIAPDSAHEKFLNAVIRSANSLSSYFSGETFENLKKARPEERTGIGAMISKSGHSDYAVISQLLDGGSATLSGSLHPGDEIVFVKDPGGERADCSLLELVDLTNLTAGKPDTSVTLTLASPSYLDAPRKVVSLTRSRPPPQKASAYLTEKSDAKGSNATVGVIELHSFYGDYSTQNKATASSDVARLLQRLKSEAVQAIVLDLRDNGGGLLHEAIATTGLFVKNAPILQLKQTNRDLNIRKSENKPPEYSGPLVVLLSQQSAAATEILAGALRHYGKAIIVGDAKTAGSGDIHQVFSLEPYYQKSSGDSPAGAVKIAIGAFYLPNGTSVAGEGIQPDIIIPSLNVSQFTDPSNPRYPKIKSAAKADPIPKQPLESLRKLSIERRNLSQNFANYEAYLDWLQKQKSMTSTSLNKEERIKLRDENRETETLLIEAITSPSGPIWKINNLEADEREIDEKPLIDIQLQEAIEIAIDASKVWKTIKSR